MRKRFLLAQQAKLLGRLSGRQVQDNLVRQAWLPAASRPFPAVPRNWLETDLCNAVFEAAMSASVRTLRQRPLVPLLRKRCAAVEDHRHQQLIALPLHGLELGLGQFGQSAGGVSMPSAREARHFAGEVGLEVAVVDHEQVGPMAFGPIDFSKAK